MLPQPAGLFLSYTDHPACKKHVHVNVFLVRKELGIVIAFGLNF